MLPRRFLSFLLAIKIAATQTVYPTTQVSYSTSAVPTVQTYPVSPTVTAIPSASASPVKVTATAMPTAISATAIPATAISATAIPATAMSSTPSVTFIESSKSPTISPLTPKPSSKDTAAKAYFLPANIPDPKVTFLPQDLPNIAEVKPKICSSNGFVEVKADKYNPITRKDSGSMTAVKRITMACTDDFISPNDPVCPGIPKLDITKAPIMTKDPKSNPIDHEVLLDSFMTCL